MENHVLPTSSTPRPALSRLARYAVLKAVILFATVAAGLYLTILVVNLGGYVDAVFRSDVADEIGGLRQSGAFEGLTYEQIQDLIWTTRWIGEEERGLHVPFMVRTWRWFLKAMLLDWGDGPIRWIISPGGGNYVAVVRGDTRAYLLHQFPYTMLLVGASTLLLFFASVFLALNLSRRRRGRFLNWLIVVLSSATSVPPWIHGLLLIFFFVTLAGIFPYPRLMGGSGGAGGTLALNLPAIWMFLKQIFLPVLALFISLFFQSVYTWRSFFLIYSEEDYVEMARAKGLPDGMLERRYILRPTLPYILTNFVMLVVSMWQATIALELLFGWPGLGAIFAIAIRTFHTPLLLGIVAIFAYLLAITVFLLDILYALIDPRVRIESGAPKARLLTTRKWAFPFHKPKQTFEKRMLTPLDESFRPFHSNPRPARLFSRLGHGLKRFTPTLSEVLAQPAGALGLVIILVLVAAAIYSRLAYPGDEAVRIWSLQGETLGEWRANPANAAPVWFNVFRREKLPKSILLSSREDKELKEAGPLQSDIRTVTFAFPFDYSTGILPQQLNLSLESNFQQKPPLVSLTWLTPDGRTLDLGNVIIKTAVETYYVSEDERLQRKLGGRPVVEALFTDPAGGRVVKGRYTLQVKAFLFEPEADLEAEMVLFGQAFGLAGTDSQRRDLTLPLLNGIPLALAFGVLGAVATSLLSMALAAAGAWYGGWVDILIQRISDVNMILPTLAIAILVFLMYTNSIWAVLGVLVLLSIFGSPLKNYRAAFLQIKESPYIEAAQAYGASGGRLVWHYLVPRILPVMLPQLVTMVPVYVYYEATLAFLGVRDPLMPTWGKVIYEALSSRAFQVYPHRILIPVALLVLTGLGFALLGLALEQVLNPRLREK